MNAMRSRNLVCASILVLVTGCSTGESTTVITRDVSANLQRPDGQLEPLVDQELTMRVSGIARTDLVAAGFRARDVPYAVASLLTSLKAETIQDLENAGIESGVPVEIFLAEMAVRRGVVQFVTDPEGASVRDSNGTTWTTNVDLWLQPGEHRFWLELDGFPPSEVIVPVEAKEVTEVHHRFSPDDFLRR